MSIKARWRLTLLQQFVISIIVAFMPLTIVVSVFLQALDQQLVKNQQQALLSQVITSEFNQFTDNITSLERAIRQNWLLKDSQLERLINQEWQQTEQGYGALVEKLALHENVAIWQQLQKQLKNIDENIIVAGEKNEIFFTELQQQLTQAELWLRAWQQQQVSANQKAIQTLQQDFIRWLIALIPLSLLIAAGFIGFISRGLQQITQAISLLGQGQWQKKVKASGSVELIELSEKLEWMRQQLASLEQQKTTFLQHVTHELKTPLASMIEGVDLLLEEIPGPINQQQAKILQLLSQGSERLRYMIESLLNYNAIKIKRDQTEPLDFQQLEQSIQQHFEQRLVSKQQRLLWQVEGSVERCYLDSELIEIILIQLLSNAIKFSPQQAEVSVLLNVSQQALILQVVDQGPGIDDNEHNKIFEAFYLGEQGKASHLQGSGLGLTLVRECVNQFNGQLQIKPESQLGAHFVIELPLVNKGLSKHLS